MTRIIAGVAGGRRLAVPPRPVHQADQRPDQGGPVRCGAGDAGRPEGAAVLDLYAGSGAVGLEALSRGAADVLLIESDPGAAQAIRRNIEAVGLPGARLVQDRVDRALRRGPGTASPRDLVFADPPYSAADDELGKMLVTLAGQGWLARDALVILERDARSGAPPWPAGYAQRPVQALRRDDALVRSRVRSFARFCENRPHRRERESA